MDKGSTWALVDSGAADNFISATPVAKLKIQKEGLASTIGICVGNGEIIQSNYFVAIVIQLGSFRTKAYFKVLNTPIPMVLGYTFLIRHQPVIDWLSREMTITRRGFVYRIRGCPALSVE